MRPEDDHPGRRISRRSCLTALVRWPLLEPLDPEARDDFLALADRAASPGTRWSATPVIPPMPCI